MNIVLVGAVESTAVTLQALMRHGMQPRLVITLPPGLSGQHSDFADIGQEAAAAGIDVLHAADVNAPEVISRLRSLAPDLIFVVGWSRLCKAEFLRLAKIGTIGYHPTLLPALRGRSVLSWTLLLDLETTGGTLFWIDEGTDSGDIAAQRQFAVRPGLYLGELLDQHMQCLAEMLDTLLPRLLKGERPAVAQKHSDASYAAQRKPKDGLIDWNRPAAEIARLVRSVSRPYPGAFSHINGQKLCIWRAEVVDYPNWHAQNGQVFVHDDDRPVVRCGGSSSLRLEEVELDGGNDASALLKGQVKFDDGGAGNG